MFLYVDRPKNNTTHCVDAESEWPLLLLCSHRSSCCQFLNLDREKPKNIYIYPLRCMCFVSIYVYANWFLLSHCPLNSFAGHRSLKPRLMTLLLGTSWWFYVISFSSWVNRCIISWWRPFFLFVCLQSTADADYKTLQKIRTWAGMLVSLSYQKIFFFPSLNYFYFGNLSPFFFTTKMLVSLIFTILLLSFDFTFLNTSIYKLKLLLTTSMLCISLQLNKVVWSMLVGDKSFAEAEIYMVRITFQNYSYFSLCFISNSVISLWICFLGTMNCFLNVKSFQYQIWLFYNCWLVRKWKRGWESWETW